MEGVLLLLLIAVACYLIFGRKKEPEIRARVTTSHGDNFRFNGPETDSEDDLFEDSKWGNFRGGYKVKATLLLNYIDGMGQKSQRTIDTISFDDYDTEGYIYAHCRLRGDRRTFRTDRIQRCVDTETGEIIENIPRFFRQTYENSPEYKTELLLQAEHDSLRILLYMGKADGQLRAAEKAVICETCRKLEPELSAAHIEKLLPQIEVPSIHAFKLAVGRQAKRTHEHRTLLFETAHSIVKTQKTVHPVEQEALDYMAKRLFSGAN